MVRSLCDEPGSSHVGVRSSGHRDRADQLGAQQAQAVTSSSGIAQTSLVLNQKNGSYPLTTTWTPGGTDAARWTGASAAGTFVIGNK